MSGRRRVKIHPYDKTSLFKRLLNDFFKVDGYWVSYELYPKEDAAGTGAKNKSAQKQRAETDEKAASNERAAAEEDRSLAGQISGCFRRAGGVGGICSGGECRA